MKASEVKEVGKIVHDSFEDGIRFIVMRGPSSWCGYVGVPLSHPLSGFHYDAIPVNAHGGLTFASEGKDVKDTSWPKDFYWYGWDYAHCGDRCVFDVERGTREDGKDWTLDEVVKDSWDTKYEFKKLMQLAEKIAIKK